MAITPIDIHNKEFNTRFKGYDQEQVNDYLDDIIQEFETLLQKNQELEKKISFCEEKIGHYEGIQETLNKSIIVAQEAADRLKKNANKEAEMIIFEAERTADKLLKDAARKATAINRETDALQRDSRVFRQKLQLLIETQLEMVKSEEWDELLKSQKNPEVVPPTVKEVVDARRKRVRRMEREANKQLEKRDAELHDASLDETRAFEPIHRPKPTDSEELPEEPVRKAPKVTAEVAPQSKPDQSSANEQAEEKAVTPEQDRQEEKPVDVVVSTDQDQVVQKDEEVTPTEELTPEARAKAEIEKRLRRSERQIEEENYDSKKPVAAKHQGSFDDE